MFLKRTMFSHQKGAGSLKEGKNEVSQNELRSRTKKVLDRLAYDSAPKEYFLAPNFQHQKKTI